MADNQLELREATKNLRLATEELQRFNQTAGYEIAKIVGKDVGGIAETFTRGFMQVPGVQTLGAIGKTLFNRAFAAMKEKRELKLIQDRLRLSDIEIEEFKRNKKLAEAQKKVNEQFKSGAESLLGIEVVFEEGLEKAGVKFVEAAKGAQFQIDRTAITDGLS